MHGSVRGRHLTIVRLFAFGIGLYAPSLALCVRHAHADAQASGDQQRGHQRQWVRDLIIDGSHAFSAGAIRAKLATQSTGWWPFARKQWFDPAALDLDVRRIAAFYADRGYFDARVDAPELHPREDGSLEIVIHVQENAPSQIEQVIWQDFPAREEAGAREMARAHDVSEGAIVDADKVTDLAAALQYRLIQHGYAHAVVSEKIEVDRDRHAAAIELRCQPGPEVRMGETEVVGNGSIPARVVLNRVAWNPGDLYDPRDLERTRARIYALGVFSTVHVEVLGPPPAPRADVRITLLSGKLRELKLGGGVAAEQQRQEVRLRAEWIVDDFLGGLRQLRLRMTPAYVVIPGVTQVEQSGPAGDSDVQLRQPDLFGSQISGEALVGYDLGIAVGYQYYGPRTQLGFDRPFFRGRVLVGASWNLQHLNFFNVNQDVFGDPRNRFFGFQNPYRLNYLEEFVQLDLRDSPIVSRSGVYLAVSGEQGVPLTATGYHYVKITPEARVYFPLSAHAVLAARGLGGWLAPFDGDQSPITRRYALGGPSNQRGFGLGRLSPELRDNTGQLVPVGGDGQLLFSLEARLAVAQLYGAWLGIVPFVDAGDVTPRFEDLDLARLHVAVGASLEYRTPIGPVRAGLGVRVNRMGDHNPDPDERIAFHLSLGEAF